jgi:hypothetical protein
MTPGSLRERPFRGCVPEILGTAACQRGSRSNCIANKTLEAPMPPSSSRCSQLCSVLQHPPLSRSSMAPRYLRHRTRREGWGRVVTFRYTPNCSCSLPVARETTRSGPRWSGRRTRYPSCLSARARIFSKDSPNEVGDPPLPFDIIHRLVRSYRCL